MTDLFAQLGAALADRYRIERELGAGGMATVYLARDLKHERQVAIKVLRPEIAAAVGPERFLREIKITAQLNHPHILPLLDSGAADGFLFYVMPYVEGESLRDRLHREKQLPVEDALKIASEVADALHSAYKHDVIHRDIKPENILLEEGHAVVADFGIARAVHVAGGEALTETGVTVGTPAYMSPEHATGGRDLEGRSDIYSLGCVLYEMLAGQPPFTGPTQESLIHQHLTAEPAPVNRLRPGVPASTMATLERMLAKTPADRPSAAGDLASALRLVDDTAARRETPLVRRMSLLVASAVILIAGGLALWRVVISPNPAEAERMLVLAVMPAVNLGSAQDEMIAEGLALEVQSRLSGLSGLQVISSTSTQQYEGISTSARDIGEELGADYVLRFSIQWHRSGEDLTHVRVIPELIDVAANTQIWSAVYDQTLRDVFDLQSRVAARVVDALDVTLLEPERRVLAGAPTQDATAWQFYLEGNAFLKHHFSSESARDAVDAFEQATRADSSFALAYAKLAMAHYAAWWTRFDRTGERLGLIKDAADKALELAPELAEARLARGLFYYQGGAGDLGQALEEMQRALTLAPNNPTVLDGISLVQRRLGHFEQSARNGSRASDLNPLDRNSARDAALVYLRLRQYDNAERYLDRANRIRPISQDLVRIALLHLMRDGDTAQARAVLNDMPPHLRIEGIRGAAMTFQGSHVVPRVICRMEECADALTAWSEPHRSWGRAGLHLGKAELHGIVGDSALARTHADSAVTALSQILREQSDELRVSHPAQLSLAYARAGYPALAREQAARVVASRPISRDALWGPDLLTLVAEAYVLIGDPKQAIDLLAEILSVPSLMSASLLRVDPAWDPLRGDPGFQALLAQYEN